jgi:ubiquinone/menaquinone biosynthesis C-methylase UbiE
MGHTDHERRRLSLQAQVLNPLTRDFLERAGIGPGMRVLDLGCGVGEVSLIAARMVGPGGYVTGIDIDPAALEISRARAAAEGLHHAAFEEANVADYLPGALFDAITGRLILIHTADPVAIVRRAASFLAPGGIVALQDYDLSRILRSCPPKPLRDRTVQLFEDFFARAMPQADIGMRLFQIFLDAGLTAPQCRAECPMDGGPDTVMHEWFAETVRTLLPRIEAMGLTAPGEIDIETLAERLRDEAVSIGGCVVGPILVGAFARKL